MSPAERTLAALVDAFLPAADGLPSASEMGVHTRLLAEVDALGKPALRRQLDMLLWAADNPLGNLAVSGRPVRVSKLDEAGRQAWLKGLAASPLPLRRTAFQDLKRLTLLLAYGIEDSPWRAQTGFVAPVPDEPSVSAIRVRTPKPGEVIEADVVVIGSGAGGGVTAQLLAEAGRRVVVLEQATMVTEDRFGGPELDGLGDLFLDRGLAATSDRWISIRAGAAVGGGTVVNWSSSLRAPDAVRDEWRAAGVGDDLDEHYDAISEAIGVTTAESALNGPNGKLAAGLDALGIPWQPMPRSVRGCGDCGPCAVGCRSGAKQSVLRVSLAAACAAGAEVLDQTRAVRILRNGDRAVGVVAHVPGGGITVRASQIALAGGSILSPAVLLRSGIAEGTAGRNLHLHPVTAIGAIYDDSLAPWSGAPQTVMSDHFGEIDGPWGFRMEAAPTHPGLIASGFPWWGPERHSELMRRCDNVAAFIAIIRDESTGRITADKGGGVTVHYAPGTREREHIRRAQVELAKLHRAAGARRIVPLVTPPLDWDEGQPFDPWLDALAGRPVESNRVLLFTAHQMSTCRIGTSPRDSVADPDGQVWGTPGLWVTDASAMPTATGVNPQLSLMALARRTATRMLAAS